MYDHHVENRVVLAAVEAIQILVRCARLAWSDTSVITMIDVKFDKFMEIWPDTGKIKAFCNRKTFKTGDISATLITKKTSQKTGITRAREHAAITFTQDRPNIPRLPFDLAAALEGVALKIKAKKVYQELVRFGPAYHNLLDPAFISEDGVLATVQAPDYLENNKNLPAGSAFPLDAAFHAACLWAQRFAGTVAFPVGINRRVIFNKTRPGKTYTARVVPVPCSPGLLTFDVWIFSNSGNLFEAVLGVSMRNVSGGRIVPPDWITALEKKDPLAHIKAICQAVVIIEIETLTPFSAKSLASFEQDRFQGLGVKRKPGYLAARIACKRLARRLSGGDKNTPADFIITTRDDRKRPCCPLVSGEDPYFCTVSHDRRFAIAAAAEDRIGIDVEEVSERVLKSKRLYMSQVEQEHVGKSELGAEEAAVRVWSLKEAVAKALDISLADAWQRVQVTKIGLYESRLQFDGIPRGQAVHDVVSSHVFTCVRF